MMRPIVRTREGRVVRFKVCAEHCREYRQALKKGGTAQAPRS